MSKPYIVVKNQDGLFAVQFAVSPAKGIYHKGESFEFCQQRAEQWNKEQEDKWTPVESTPTVAE